MSLFGKTLTRMLDSATEDAKAGFHALAKTTDEAILRASAAGHAAGNAVGAAATRTWGAAKGAAVDVAKGTSAAAKYVAGKTVDGAVYVANKATDAAHYVEKETVAAYDYAADRAEEARDFAVTRYRSAEKKVSDTVKAARAAAGRWFNPQSAGAPIQGCPKKEKAARVEARAGKIAAGHARLNTFVDPQGRLAMAHATERLERNNVAVERARLAADVYEVGKGDPPDGWRRMEATDINDLIKTGFDTSLLPQLRPDFNPAEYESGFYMEVYKPDPKVFGPNAPYVLAFRGTQGVPLVGEDWMQGNNPQAVGTDSKYYDQAIKVTQSLKKSLAIQGKALEVTGHSLAGGMTTAASIVTGTPGYAFDTAGVHPNTLGDFKREAAVGLVQNFSTEDEILTSVQDPLFQLGAMSLVSPLLAAFASIVSPQAPITYPAAGPIHKVPALTNAKEVAEATAQGNGVQGIAPGFLGRTNNLLNPIKKVDLHDPTYVIAGLEQQKADDLATIDHYLGL